MIKKQTKLEIAEQFYDQRSLFKFSQVRWIIKQAGDRLDGETLFFGSGRDSFMWSKITDATFIENHKRWYRKLFEEPQNKELCVHLVDYSTRVETWQEDLKEGTVNELPAEVLAQKFDVIVIDGPKGNKPSAPGRVSPILLAQKLVRKGGLIVIDDLGRELERNVAREVLGEPDCTHKSRSRLGGWFF